MNRRIQHLAFRLVLLGSLVVRMFQINGPSYWIDEMTSVHIAKSPYITSVFWDNCPFLYHFLLKIWILAVGDGEIATRGLSVFFSVATTAVLMFYCQRRFGFRAGIIAGVLHALYPLSVAYAQETRMYALFEFFAAVNLVCFLEYRDKKLGAKPYLISIFLLGLSHYLAVIPIALQIGMLAKGKSRALAVKAFAIAAAVLVVSYLVSFSWAHLEWQRLKYMVEPQSGHVQEVLLDLLFGSWPTLVGVLTIAGLWLRVEKRRGEALLGIRIFAATLVLLFVLAFVFQRSVFHSRYFIFLIPYLVISLAGMAVRVEAHSQKMRFVMGALGLLILGFSMNTIIQGDFRAVKAPWRNLAKQVAKDPTSMVFTTRTLAIQSPYFERENIPVDFFSPTAPVDELVELVDLGATVWIVDAYWSALTYVPGTVESLKAKGLKAEEFVFKTGKSDVIIAIRITSA